MSYGRQCAVCEGGIHDVGTKLHQPYVKVNVVTNRPNLTRSVTVYVHDRCGGEKKALEAMTERRVA